MNERSTTENFLNESYAKLQTSFDQWQPALSSFGRCYPIHILLHLILFNIPNNDLLPL